MLSSVKCFSLNQPFVKLTSIFHNSDSRACARSPLAMPKAPSPAQLRTPSQLTDSDYFVESSGLAYSEDLVG